MTHVTVPEWADPSRWLQREYSETDALQALHAQGPATPDRLAALLAPVGDETLEAMARRARDLTRRHFGKTIALYAPLYLSDYCSGGCTYCGFAADRNTPRHRLEPDALEAEMEAMAQLGIEDILLLTGERTPKADYTYLLDCVARAAKRFPAVSIEAFAMNEAEYAGLAEAGCIGMTVYQETYDPETYDRLHRWGEKKNYLARLEAPARALAAGMRMVGLGALLGIAEPRRDLLSLFLHGQHLLRRYWRGGVMFSFPRVCPQEGGWQPPFPVDERMLAQAIYGFRICLPDVPLVLSTRERAAFRDGMMGVGINRMSVASKTTVGGYRAEAQSGTGQFDVRDPRGVEDFCAALRQKQLEPVFKNWDAVFTAPSAPTPDCRP